MRKFSLKFQKNKQARFYFIVFFSVNSLTLCSIFGQSASPTPPPETTTTVNSSAPPTPTDAPISRDQAIEMTLRQVSNYNQTRLNEGVISQDLLQSKASLYPKISANPLVVLTSPSLTGSNVNGSVRPPSYLGANAIAEYQGLVTAAGEIDISGRLRATVRRNQALLEAARSGTEAARRTLIGGLDESYLNLALAETKTMAARENLRVAEEFENLTKLLAEGGEAAPIDAVRAGVQTTNRHDELSQAELAEQQAADALRVFIGYDFSRPVSVGNLLTSVPDLTEFERITSGASNETRPEILQLNAEKRAAEEDVKIAKAELRPQLTYILDGGFISDSLLPRPILETLGVRATIGVTIPIFDFGIGKSRIRQAETRAQIAEQTKLFTERMLRAAISRGNFAGTDGAGKNPAFGRQHQKCGKSSRSFDSPLSRR